MKMVAAGLLAVLVGALVLPSAFASLEMKDVITREAYENLVNTGAIQSIAMTKTIISNPILEEALVTYAKNKLGGSIFNCGETCLLGTCFTSGCSCVYRVCSKDSLPDNNNNKAALSSNSNAYAKDVITREAYENLVNSGAIQSIAMTKTIISNPILEEALVTYANNKLGGSIFNCGETCLLGTCYTSGCSCVYRVCSKDSLPDNSNKAALSSNSKAYAKDVITRKAYENLVNTGAIQSIVMTKTIISNPILEEALVTYANNKLGGSIFNCGETCLLGTCYTSGCSCVYRVCSKDSLPDNSNNKAAVNSNSKDEFLSYAKKGLVGLAM